MAKVCSRSRESKLTDYGKPRTVAWFFLAPLTPFLVFAILHPSRCIQDYSTDINGWMSIKLQKQSFSNVWLVRSIILKKLFLSPEASALLLWSLWTPGAALHSTAFGSGSPIVLLYCMCVFGRVEAFPSHKTGAFTVGNKLFKVFPAWGIPCKSPAIEAPSSLPENLADFLELYAGTAFCCSLVSCLCEQPLWAFGVLCSSLLQTASRNHLGSQFKGSC